MLDICVPQLGEGLREVRIVELLRRSGELVKRGDALYVIETDKSTVELESPDNGRLIEWRVAPGDVVPIGSKVAVLGESSAEARAGSSRRMTQRLIPPRTRAYAHAKGLSDVDLEAISAASGKLLPVDIDAHLAHRRGSDSAAGFVDRKLGPVQRALVYRLRRSASMVIPGMIAIEFPWSWLTAESADAEGTRPTPFQVFGHAVSLVAKDLPRFRSTMQGDDTIREYRHINIGVALARPDDELIVAVIRAADQLTLGEFVRACTQQMRTALRSGDQTAEDTQILLTHLGEFGIVDAVPTLVAPASSVLFLGTPGGSDARARVVMTFDHRLINGASAARFLQVLSANLKRRSSRPPREGLIAAHASKKGRM